MPYITPAIQAAIARVLDLEKQNKVENMIIVSPAGTTLFENTGTDGSVDCAEAVDKRLIVPGSTIIHNHPEPVSLSLQDSLLAGNLKSDIWAVGHDGSRYWSSGIACWSRHRELQEVAQCYINIFMAYALAAGWTEAEINSIGEHCRNVAMADVCPFEYRYTLSPASALMAKRAQALLHSSDIGIYTYDTPSTLT
jgi:hypothetical protein